jgi:hypothetical protein
LQLRLDHAGELNENLVACFLSVSGIEGLQAVEDHYYGVGLRTGSARLSERRLSLRPERQPGNQISHFAFIRQVLTRVFEPFTELLNGLACVSLLPLGFLPDIGQTVR